MAPLSLRHRVPRLRMKIDHDVSIIFISLVAICAMDLSTPTCEGLQTCYRSTNIHVASLLVLPSHHGKQQPLHTENPPTSAYELRCRSLNSDTCTFYLHLFSIAACAAAVAPDNGALPPSEPPCCILSTVGVLSSSFLHFVKLSTSSFGPASV